MFLTNILLKKVKSKGILVMVESIASGHRYAVPRDRVADKLELIKFDPYVQAMVVYKEKKKLTNI